MLRAELGGRLKRVSTLPASRRRLRLRVALGRDQLELTGGLDERDADDVGAAQRHHDAERLVVDRLDSVHAEPGGKHPVEGRRGAAALDVAEHGAAGLFAVGTKRPRSGLYRKAVTVLPDQLKVAGSGPAGRLSHWDLLALRSAG